MAQNFVKLGFLNAVLTFSEIFVARAHWPSTASSDDNGLIAKCVSSAATFFDANATAAAALTEQQLLLAAWDFTRQFAQRAFTTTIAPSTFTRDATVSTAIATFISTVT